MQSLEKAMQKIWQKERRVVDPWRTRKQEANKESLESSRRRSKSTREYLKSPKLKNQQARK